MDPNGQKGRASPGTCRELRGVGGVSPGAPGCPGELRPLSRETPPRRPPGAPRRPPGDPWRGGLLGAPGRRGGLQRGLPGAPKLPGSPKPRFWELPGAPTPLPGAPRGSPAPGSSRELPCKSMTAAEEEVVGGRDGGCGGTTEGGEEDGGEEESDGRRHQEERKAVPCSLGATAANADGIAERMIVL